MSDDRYEELLQSESESYAIEAGRLRVRVTVLEAELASCLGHKTKIALTLRVAELEDWVKHVQNAHADECSTCNDRARAYFAQSGGQK